MTADTDKQTSLWQQTPRWMDYAASVLLVAILTVVLNLLRGAFPLADYPMPYIVVTMAIAYMFGTGPAIVACVLEWIAFTYLYVSPRNQIWPLAVSPEDWARQAAFLLGVTIVASATIQVRKSKLRILERTLQMEAEIREREQAEDRLRQSEAKLIEAQRLAKLGNWEWDVESDEVSWSMQMYEIFGRSQEMPPPAYEDYVSRYSEESWTRLENAVRRALETGEPYELELEHIRENGTHGWHIANGEAVRDSTGRIVKVRGTAQDITEHKQAEEAIRRSEERYRALVAASSELLYHMSPDWSEMRQLHSHGFLANTEESNPNWLHEYIPPEAQEHVTAAINNAIRTKSLFELEHQVWRADGGIGWTFSRAVPLMNTNGEIIEWFGAASDVTNRKRAEEECARAREEAERRAGETQAMMDLAPIAIWIAHDPECKQITGNAYADYLIMNVPRGVNISRSASPDEMVVDYKVFRNGVELEPEQLPAQVAAATGKPIAEEELELVFSDGRRINLLMGAAPLFDYEGRVRGAVAAGLDITEHRRLEDHKREFYRKTILAATDGKLLICEKEEIREIAGPALGSWKLRTKDDLATPLSQAKDMAINFGMELKRVYEFMGGITEAATNVIKHANDGTMTIHRVDDRIIGVLSDTGPGIGAMALPDVALTKFYSTAGTLGMGYKLMIQFSDMVYLSTDPGGTTVAIEMRLQES